MSQICQIVLHEELIHLNHILWIRLVDVQSMKRQNYCHRKKWQTLFFLIAGLRKYLHIFWINLVSCYLHFNISLKYSHPSQSKQINLGIIKYMCYDRANSYGLVSAITPASWTGCSGGATTRTVTGTRRWDVCRPTARSTSAAWGTSTWTNSSVSPRTSGCKRYVTPTI